MPERARTNGAAPVVEQQAKAQPLFAQLITQLPPIIDLDGLRLNFGITKTPAYLLASEGEITALTVGPAGTRGRRMFLTESVLAYVQRRAAGARPLNCKSPSKRRKAVRK